MTNDKTKGNKNEKNKLKTLGKLKKMKIKIERKNNQGKFVDYVRQEAVKGKFLILKYSNLKVF